MTTKNPCIIQNIKDKILILQQDIFDLRRSLYYTGFNVSCPNAQVSIGGEDGVILTKTSVGTEEVPVCDMFTKRIKVGTDSIRIDGDKILFGTGTTIDGNNIGSPTNPFANIYAVNLDVDNEVDNFTINGNLVVDGTTVLGGNANVDTFINGNLYVVGNIFGTIDGNVETTNLSLSGNLNVGGETTLGLLSVSGNTILSNVEVNNLHVLGTEDSTSISNGALIVDGGVGINSNLHVGGGIYGNVTGDLTGNVTGDVTGDVTGNVTGDVTGDLTGNVTGDVTGDLTGNMTGDVTGNVTGDVTGDVTGNVTGDVTGDLTGNVTGDVTGDLTGNVTGDVTGDLTGNVTGDVTGNVTGDLTGNVTGNVSGDVTGDLTGNVSGDVTGDLTGNVSGDVTGDLTGNVTGDVTGNVTGDVTGNVTGDVTGDLTGNVTGDVTGDLTGNVTGDVTGNVTGDLTGNVTGDVTGDLTGNVTGDVTGNVTGDLTGNVTGNVTGDVTGDLTGNVSGDVTGNVTGDLTGNVTGDVTGNVTGDLTGNVTGDLTVFGNTNITKDLDVLGDTYLQVTRPYSIQFWDSTTTGTIYNNPSQGILITDTVGGGHGINIISANVDNSLNFQTTNVSGGGVHFNANTVGNYGDIQVANERDMELWSRQVNSSIILTPSTTGNVEVNNTTESTSTSSGALIVDGGVGINSNLHVGGGIYGVSLTDGQAIINSNTVTASTITDGIASLTGGNCIVNYVEIVEGVNIALGQQITDLVRDKTVLDDGSTTDLGTAPLGSYTLYSSETSGSGNAISQFAVCNNGTFNTVSIITNVPGTNGNLDANITTGNLLVFTDGTGTGNVNYDFVISGIFHT
jgi:hypothetical protein